MRVPTSRVSSGVPDVDGLLHGLIPGDNVVWVSDDADVLTHLEDQFLAAAARSRLPRGYVTTTAAPEAIEQRTGGEFTVFDARPRRPHAAPDVLEQALVEFCSTPRTACVVLDGLDAMARRWGAERALAFFSRACPRMFDAGAIAYWRAPRKQLGGPFLTQVQSVTQCVLEVSSRSLRVLKAEGRPRHVQGIQFGLSFENGGIHLDNERALGRLARGLEQIRRQRNLSQADMARLAGVSSSAVSQAESGRRGLSLDTLLVLSERLGVTVDALLGGVPGPGYVLARRDRGGSAGSSAALLDDPAAGLRAYLVTLGAGEAGVPPVAHQGVVTVLVASGLVQVRVADDTPVMRAGDALIATDVAVEGWRNLTMEQARLFWVLRD